MTSPKLTLVLPHGSVSKAPSGGSTDSMGVNASAGTEEEEEEAVEEPLEEAGVKNGGSGIDDP